MAQATSKPALAATLVLAALAIVIGTLVFVNFNFNFPNDTVPSPPPSITLTPTEAPTVSPTPNPTPNFSLYRTINWAGYVASSNLQDPQATVTSISGSWTVPTITPTENNTFSNAWIGIGGRYDQTLIQCGTEHAVINGRPVYTAWYELLPESTVKIWSMHVSPGDQMTASIQLLNGTSDRWHLTLIDVTSGSSFQSVFTYNSTQLSADWIFERPKVNGEFSTLSIFSDVAFTNCTATINGVTGPINSFPFSKAIMHSLEPDGTEVTATSDLGADGASFTVTDLSPNATTI